MEEQLISAVFKREAIWNPRHALHKNVHALQKMWKEIGDEIGKDVQTIKNKWKYLRDYFNKETKKLEKPRSGSGLNDITTSTWPYYSLLLFLKDILRDHLRSTNIEGIETENFDTKFNDTEDLEPQNVLLPSSSNNEIHSKNPSTQSSSSTTTSENLSQTRKRKRPPVINNDELIMLEKRKIELLESEIHKEDDDDLLFMKSLIPYMKGLPASSKLRLRLKFQELLLREVEEHELVT